MKRSIRLGKWTACVSSDWPAVFRPRNYNWIDFTFIAAAMERMPYLDSPGGPPCWDFHFALLGFHVFVSNGYDYAATVGEGAGAWE